ncbi:MAG: LAGLIDADG family homing endonuclease [Nanoarchaeota archaeon]
MNKEIVTNSFVEKYKNKKINWGFNGMGYVVYKRTYARLKENSQTEEWHETIQRCINGAQKIGADYTKDEAEKLFDYIFNFKCTYPGRMLWQLGTSAVDKFGGNSLLNCWFCSIQRIEDFCFIFENLMLGGGVGYSVRREDVYQLPKVKKDVNVVLKNTKDADFICPDSREGWVSLLFKLLESFFITGKSFSYSTILVRGAGELIKGFGGTASGPKILVDGITNICDVLNGREGKRVRSVDVLDICNIIGSIVVSGNVRRSAQISLGDPDDILFLKAKRWDLGNIPNWRAMSNNTIYADNYDHIMETVWDGYGGNGEPYGFFNLDLSQNYGRLGEKKKDNCVGLNPCQPYSAPILTKNGITKLGLLSIDDEIWSESGWTRIVNKWSNGIKKVFKYTTSVGTFYGTENHSIISNSEKIQVNEAETIDSLSGEYKNSIEFNIENIMDGLVIGDGTVHEASNNLVTLCIGENDGDYFKSEIKNLILKERKGVGRYNYEIGTTIIPEEIPLTFNRDIPDRFFYGGRNKVCSFLRGLYSANGSVCGNRVTLKTSSPKIREKVQILLSSLGIRSYFTINKAHSVEFSNGPYMCRESYDVNISIDREKFVSIIGFIQEYKIEKLNLLIDKLYKSKYSRTNNIKTSFEIKEIEFISEEEVFDITVDNEPHTYWTGGLNVSNCGEITLSSYENCNLSELFLNNINSKDELIDCAKLLYKTQKAVSALNFIHEETNKIVHKNMRLGLGVTGICQSLEKVEWLDDCYKELKKFDIEWSKKKNYPESIKLTTVKPSGTVSLLGNATPGVHPAYDRFYIRRIRMASNDKLVDLCKQIGCNVEFLINFDGSVNHDTVVVSFPCKVDEKTIIANEISAVRQLELVKKLQTLWSDNAVSATVYYKKEELPEIKSWLKENYKTSIKSISFLLHQDHGFVQAPYESISKDKYDEISKKIKVIDNISFVDVNGFAIEGLECAGGVCPIK